jgi:hypothetical protein
MTDDFTLLASAYLDGQATAADRAQVEGDAELLVEVERLRRVRSVLGDPGDENVAPLSTRERHLAAALDTWDRLPASERLGDATPTGIDQAGAAGGASITAPVRLREQRAKRRPVSTRVLTAAAAVVVLAGAGLVVRGALETSSSDESADTASIELDGAADEDPSLDVLAAEEFATEGQGEAADEVAEAAAPAPAVEPDAAAAGGPEQAPAERDLEVLSSNAELAQFANDLVLSRSNQTAPANPAEETEKSAGAPQADSASADAAQATAPTAPPTLPAPVDLCGLVDDFVGFASWDGSGLVNEPIAVGIDNSSAQAVAYQADTCTEVARTRLP